MGLFKLCQHRGRDRDRCAHAWWGSFRGKRVSLGKWTNRAITSKSEAQAALDELRMAIRQRRFDPRGSQPDPPVGPLTFRQLVADYKEKHVEPNRPRTAQDFDYRVRLLVEHFGDRLAATIRTADVEDFVADLKRPPGAGGRVRAAATINRQLELLRHIMNWAVGREYLARTPFRRGDQPLISLEDEDNRRKRRVTEHEEARLLVAAPPFLRALIITAIDTGLRRGEMLALRFGDINWTDELIVVRGETAKSGKTRDVPIATDRLRSVLGWMRRDPAGQQKPDSDLVFGVGGKPVVSFRRVWITTVLKAHDVKTTWVKGASGPGKKNWRELSPESLDAFRRIDLHWHDLRHEYASRLVERGVPLSQVRDLLGHESIRTTERYDNQTQEALRASARRLESGKIFDPGLTHSGPEFQESFKIEADRSPADKRSRGLLASLPRRFDACSSATAAGHFSPRRELATPGDIPPSNWRAPRNKGAGEARTPAPIRRLSLHRLTATDWPDSA